jgi:hypothetical protein
MAERNVHGQDEERERPEVRVKFQAPQVDGGADFRVIWKADRMGDKTAYSLVQVPVVEPVELVYSKPIAELDFTMSPSGDGENWHLIGGIDSDIVELLGMPVQRRRVRSTAPVIGEANIGLLRNYGNVDASDPEVLDVSLTVPVDNIAQLLDGLWNPKIARTQGRRLFSLEDNGTGNRILPQKSPPTGKIDAARLFVRRPVPASSAGNPVVRR